MLSPDPDDMSVLAPAEVPEKALARGLCIVHMCRSPSGRQQRPLLVSYVLLWLSSGARLTSMGFVVSTAITNMKLDALHFAISHL